jgi:hypothetical protein
MGAGVFGTNTGGRDVCILLHAHNMQVPKNYPGGNNLNQCGVTCTGTGHQSVGMQGVGMCVYGRNASVVQKCTW